MNPDTDCLANQIVTEQETPQWPPHRLGQLCRESLRDVVRAGGPTAQAAAAELARREAA